MKRCLRATLRVSVISLSLAITAIFCSAARAHPIEYHMQPLDAQTVEQVVQSLELMVGELRNNSSLNAARLPDGPMDVSLLLWSIQGAIMDIDDSGTLDGPVLKRTLLSAGYKDSPYVAEEWQAEAEQVLETYEVLARDLSRATIQARYAAFNKERPELGEDQALTMESALIRDQQLLRTTADDLEIVRQFRPRLDALTAQLGKSVR